MMRLALDCSDLLQKTQRRTIWAGGYGISGAPAEEPVSSVRPCCATAMSSLQRACQSCHLLIERQNEKHHE